MLVQCSSQERPLDSFQIVQKSKARIPMQFERFYYIWMWIQVLTAAFKSDLNCYQMSYNFTSGNVNYVDSSRMKIFSFQKQPPEVFCKKGILRNFAKFTGKQLCQRLWPVTYYRPKCFLVNSAKFLRTPPRDCFFHYSFHHHYHYHHSSHHCKVHLHCLTIFQIMLCHFD